MRPCLPLLFGLALAGCASARPSAREVTHYRVGDYVIYRYQGLALGGEVTLREQVVAQDQNRLRIDVHALRGSSERSWVQVLTDTPENQQANRLDALWAWMDDRWVKLGNQDNKDLYQLYDWTLFTPDAPATNVAKGPCRRDISGRGLQLGCACTTGHTTWKGRVVVFEDSECPEFLWTHGPSRFVDAATGEAILQVEVVESGREQRAPLPFDP